MPAEPLAGPLRGELLGAEHLAERIRGMARNQRIRLRPQGRRGTPLLNRLDETHRILQDAYTRLTNRTDDDAGIGPAGEWFLDNYHVIREHMREVRESLPRGYYRELPELVSGPLVGYPRVYELAITLISHSEGRVDIEILDRFVEAFQEVESLSIGELWALPAMLRLGLIESVRRMTLRTVQRLDQTDAADDWARRIEAASEQSDREFRAILRDFVFNPPPLTPIFVSRFLQQIRLTRASYPALEVLERWIAEEGMSAEQAAAQSTQRLALTQIVMAHSITSLRAIAAMDWKHMVEQHSVLHAVLAADPAGYYARMTFATRDEYRHVVERIARRTERTEQAVATATLELAAAAAAVDAPAGDPIRGHVGYYLVDAGLEELERRMGYRPQGMEAVHRWIVRHPDLILGGGILAGTLLAVAAALALAGPDARGAWLLVALVALIPATEIAVSTLNQLITAFLPPRKLPKLDMKLSGGIPVEFRTAVVVPTLLESMEQVQQAVADLEVQYLANRDRHLHFAILSDFTDADTETVEGDDELLDAAEEGIRALNARHAPQSDDVFYLFHRPRRWNPRQGVWMGWERKRGKLAEFNRFLGSGTQEAFSRIVGDVAPLRGTKYVITLDADTVLPPDAAGLLIGALAHPLNRAVWDEERGQVVRGYGILQPRVGVSLPSAHRSRFAAIHSGDPGVDPYTTAVSDVYQDLYGEGSYTGKGIYDVDAFKQATRGRFPENTLLSHDLIEGNYARAGLVSEISLYDDYPSRYLPYTRRKHRWIRGDWQLLGWLTPRVPGPDGPERNRLSMLARWKIFDNLRRSTVEIAQLLFFVAGWTILPGSPLGWTLLGLGGIAGPWIVALLLAALRPPSDKSWRAYYAVLAEDAKTSARQLLIAIVFLPHQALISADAIGRTLWRLFVSHRNMLEWQTASQAERSEANEPLQVWRKMAPAVVLAAVILLIAMGVELLLPHVGWRPGEASLPPGANVAHIRLVHLLAAALPIIALWIVSPAIAIRLSAPTRRLRRVLPDEQRQAAMRYALLHWRYFERFVSRETNWLVPDNFQETPDPVLATRTSPTNIGLQLLATVSARDLGFIDLEEMIIQLERIFASLDRMDRLRGHFYNWYDLSNLEVLEPAYISTVDSGNLAGHLLAIRQACIEIAEELGGDPNAPVHLVRPTTGNADEGTDATPAVRLLSIATRAYRYALAMEFDFLFDDDRELFSIGYQPNRHALDTSYYDLLASEARLASFIAIAKDDVSVDHWFRLGRTLTRSAGEAALVSWSGSMFEYLMPSLVMRSFPNTVLDQTNHSAVRRQIAYCVVRGVPWGISESAYNFRDRHLTYQYRAFGVPDLALKRGLGHDLVIAPYASMLAAMIDPRRALANLAELERMGALGPFGFRDAVDYTRPDPRKHFAIVANYMAHHVGMGLVALTNVLRPDLWQRRFHADPLVRSVELLLHERIPRRLVFQGPQEARPDDALPDPDLEAPAVREFASPDTDEPHVALLGRQPYTVMVSHVGSGYGRYEDQAVTRWRADATADATGQYCYVRDVTADRVWSVAHQPTAAKADWYRARLATDRVTFHRRDGEIETMTEIAVVPDDAAEVRRVTVTNNSNEVREVELTSYGEIVLGPPDADRAHPSFGNLFVETAWHDWCTAITATRRPRSASEPSLWCVHVVDAVRSLVGTVTCETDRSRFLGRGGTTRRPAALTSSGDLSGSTGAVLDPIFSLRVKLRLSPGQSDSVAFTTLVATTRERAFELADRYHDPHAAQRALDLAWTSQQVELRELGDTPADAAVFQEIAGYLLYPNPKLRSTPELLERNHGSQPLLWAHGISGDWPILLASIDDEAGIPTLSHLFSAHRYMRRRGMVVDLVVITNQPSSYLQELNEQVMGALFASSDAGTDETGGVFIIRPDMVTSEELLMLQATARVHVMCDGRPLQRILDSILSPTVRRPEDEPESVLPRTLERGLAVWEGLGRRIRSLDLTASPSLDSPASEAPPPAPAGLAPPGEAVAPAEPERTTPNESAMPPMPAPGNGREASESALEEPSSLAFFNGIGGLNAQGDYQIHVGEGTVPPAPWTNVIANSRGGFFVTESGGGCTWAGSSYFFRLTPWHNDPVSDPPGELLYLRDEDTGTVWRATPGPGGDATPFVVRHGAGWTSFDHLEGELATTLTLGMAEHEPVKLALLRIRNQGGATRRIGVTAYAEWTLGVSREHTRHQVHTRFDSDLGTIFAANFFDPQFAGWTAFWGSSLPISSHTGDRKEFLGRNGSLDAPLGMYAEALSNTTGAGLDPCAALRGVVEIAPGETRELVVVLGAAEGAEEARALVQRFLDVDVATAEVQRVTRAWEDRLSVIRVHTPEPSFDAIINRWSLYQALACRMWARSALYQSSGAYGFRDQLQDTMAFVYAEPGIAREHILRAAARQFLEGDVQHWWHPQSGRGVRTRFSDDLAWLPYVVDHYIQVTGDSSVLEEYVPFLRMRALGPDEHEIYDLPQVTDEHGSIYEHCLRSLRRACTFGTHGLPLMGIGDWNDGMNRVGVEGRGESVWLAWFLVTTLRAFIPYIEAHGDHEVAAEFAGHADRYAKAVEENGWDGEWYRRAYFDDGTPLGSTSSEECNIDSIAQSWSVISGAGSSDRRARAMQSLNERLVDHELGLIRLLTPPFDRTTHDPGYIKGYLPGVRENGAQYTHAALWAVFATALQGDGDAAFSLFQMINPLSHGSTPEAIQRYQVEPYVVAADVYTAKGHEGRGGWTWYTGSASWMYRVGLEALLGFHKVGNTLRISPRVPATWSQFSIEYRFGETIYAIDVQNPGAVGTAGIEIEVDGQPVAGDVISLEDGGGRRNVKVRPRAGARSVRGGEDHASNRER